LILKLKNKTANAIELKNMVFSPLPSGPKILVIIIDDTKPIRVLIICAENIKEMFFLIDKAILIFLY
jgi:hypothetical protein